MEVFNRHRLRIARRRRGMQSGRLAITVNLTPQSITDFEKGVAVPCPATLARIARELQFPTEFFFGPTLREISEGGASFRALKKMTSEQRHAVISAASLALAFSEWLGERFNLPSPNVPDLRGLDAESAAVALRARWLVPSDKPLPNLIHLMERHGIRVFSLPEDYVEVDAFSCWVEDAPFVFLNTLKSGERGRFDAAHELAHLTLHRHGPPRGPELEKQANEFASALLMPASAMRQGAPRVPTVSALLEFKSTWRVSAMSLVYRLHSLKLITDRQYKAIMVEMSKRGWRKSEPGGIQREASQVLQKVFVALREDGIRRDDIARAMRITTVDLDMLIFGLVPTMARAIQIEMPPSPPSEDAIRRGLRLVK